jgi:hypothetical protein
VPVVVPQDKEFAYSFEIRFTRRERVMQSSESYGQRQGTSPFNAASSVVKTFEAEQAKAISQ